jgi:hypothetical protein
MVFFLIINPSIITGLDYGSTSPRLLRLKKGEGKGVLTLYFNITIR